MTTSAGDGHAARSGAARWVGAGPGVGAAAGVGAGSGVDAVPGVAAGPGVGTVADVAVIGAGPAGLAAAAAADAAGASVLLIDSEGTVGGQFWRHPVEADDRAGSGSAGSDPAGSGPASSGPAAGGTAGDDPAGPGRAAPLRAEDVAYLHHQLPRYRRLRALVAAGGVRGTLTHLPHREVWALERDHGHFAVHVTDTRRASAGRAAGGASPGDEPETLYARRLVIATGAYDLQLPFPGWELPGVYTAGGAQAMLKGNGVRVGERVAVVGTGPFLLSVAAGLAQSGVRVVGVYDAASPTGWLRQARGLAAAGAKGAEGAGFAATLLRHRVPFRAGWTVVRADGTDRLESVTVAPLRPDGSADLIKARTERVDALAVGWGFVPRLDIALMVGCETVPGPLGLPVVRCDTRQLSTQPGVFVAGEITGVGGAELALIEGEIAGAAAAFDSAAEAAIAGATDAAIGGAGGRGIPERQPLDGHLAALLRRRRRSRAFAAAMAKVYPVPSGWQGRLPDETVVCRCEEVTAGAIRAVARRDGAADARTVKLLARPGMGWCQGRICGYATEEIAAFETGSAPAHAATERPIAVPLPLGRLRPLDET